MKPCITLSRRALLAGAGALALSRFAHAASAYPPGL